MIVRTLCILTFVSSLAACAVESTPQESTEDQALTANEIDKTYYSDATYTTPVGGSELTCSWSKSVWGVTSHFMVSDSYSCHGGGHVVACYEDDHHQSWDVVECPAYIY